MLNAYVERFDVTENIENFLVFGINALVLETYVH